MPVEVATYIADLDATNPPGTDGLRDADNHLRLIKQTLKNTFPGLDGPITASAAHLNNAMPVGGIIMWSGASVPSGWALCDGGTYPKTDGSGDVVTPNLVNRFIYGSTIANQGQTGGTTSHTHTGITNGHVLTWGQMPSHNHGVYDPGHTHYVNDPGHAHSYEAPGGEGLLAPGGVLTRYGAVGKATTHSGTGIWLNGSWTGISIHNAGNNEPHTHGFTTGSSSNLPPYYTLAFIMKV